MDDPAASTVAGGDDGAGAVRPGGRPASSDAAAGGGWAAAARWVVLGAYLGALVLALAVLGLPSIDDAVFWATAGLVAYSLLRRCPWNLPAVAAGAYLGSMVIVWLERGSPFSLADGSPGRFAVWAGSGVVIGSWPLWGRTRGEPSPPVWRSWVQAVAMGVFAGICVARFSFTGVPLDREQVMLYVCIGLVVAAWGRRAVWRILTDWLPFALILVVYDFTRGWAHTLGLAIHYTPQLDADKALFGVVPTVWLQERLYSPQPHWWQVATSLCYLSHFVVPFVVAGVLWWRDRKRFVAFAGRFCTLAYLGLLTYILFPAAPPWIAGEKGLIPPVRRLASQGWSLIGMHKASGLIEKGQGTVNLYAAVPSLHAAFSGIVTAYLWPTTSKWLRPVLVAYPLLMGFTLVFGGEHYVSDILLGWVYVAVVMVGWRLWDKHRSASQPEAPVERASASLGAVRAESVPPSA